MSVCFYRLPLVLPRTILFNRSYSERASYAGEGHTKGRSRSWQEKTRVRLRIWYRGIHCKWFMKTYVNLLNSYYKTSLVRLKFHITIWFLSLSKRNIKKICPKKWHWYVSYLNVIHPSHTSPIYMYYIVILKSKGYVLALNVI